MKLKMTNSVSIDPPEYFDEIYENENGEEVIVSKTERLQWLKENNDDEQSPF